jgi:hypothetical protein
MSSERSVFMLAAALTGATAAFAFDNPAVLTPTCTHNNFRILEAVLPSILRRSLYDSRNSEGFEAAKFLGAHLGLTFRIAVDDSQREAFGGRPGIGPTTVMSYSDSRQEIHIHHALLHLDDSDEQKIIQDPTRLEKTARRFWPVIVHEISHARTHHSSARFVASAVIDDEYIAFYREVFFLLEQLESEPDYLGVRALAECGRDETDDQIVFHEILPRGRELAAKKRRSPAEQRELDGLRARIDGLSRRQKLRAARNPAIDSPEGDLAILLSLFARSSEDFERHIDGLYAAKRLLRLDAPDLSVRAAEVNEETIRSSSDLLARLHLSHLPESNPIYATAAASAETLRLDIGVREKARDFWKDPTLARQAIADYKNELAAVRLRAAEKRARYRLILAPFLPAAAAPASRH